MKSIYTLIICSIISSAALGQARVSLSGQIKDEQSHEPLEFCNVSFYTLQDSLVGGTATNQRGFYTIDLPMGSYKQVTSFVGNMSDTMLVDASESKFQGVIHLKPDVQMLKEASIKTNSRSTEIDRDVRVVTPELREGAFSAKYVLNKLNGVHYDEFNNSIKVDNDDRVIILVDGIEKDQEYIKNLDPERLKKIEVIRDPAGRYGLEGYSAVINIILNRNYMGVELFLQDRALTDPDALKFDYFLVQHNPTATLTYTYNKFSVYGKAGSTLASYNMDSYEEKEYESGITVEKVPSLDDDASIRVGQLRNDFTLGADYFINPRHTLSYEGRIMVSPDKGNQVNVFQTINTFQDGMLINSDMTNVNIWSNSLNTYNSVFYEGKLDERNTLKSNIVYSDFTSSQSILTIGDAASYDYGQEGSNRKQNLNYYVEYDHTFGDQSSLMLGYGMTFEALNSDFDSDLEQNNFNTSEDRNKLYGYYSREIGKKFSLRLGAAGETSSRKYEGGSQNYFIFLPHADLKYDFSSNSNIKFKVRADGKYPTINQTNPYTTFVDFESVQAGNPSLMPEVTYQFSSQLTLFQAFTLEPYYEYSKNLIITTGLLRPDNIFEYGFYNAGLYDKYGLKSNLSIPFGRSVFFQYGIDLYNSSVEFGEYNNTVKDWAMSGQLIYFHQKSKTVAGAIYQKNNNKQILAQGYRNQNIDFWSILVRRPFMNEKLTVMAMYFLPISWGVNSDQVNFIETETYSEKETTSMNFFKNMLMFEISYRFNKGKVLKREKEVEYIRENETETIF